MSWNDPPSMFALVCRALTGPDAPTHHLTVDIGHHSVRLSPQECRTELYGPNRDATLWAAIWRRAATEARCEPRDSAGAARLLVTWLAIPGVNRNLYRLLDLFPVDRADLEAEAVLGLLTALDTTGPDTPNTGSHLIRAAVRHMWSHAVRFRKEIPVVDLARYARARNAMPLLTEEQRLPPEGWELSISPPAGPTGLSASLRFTESRRQVEGERLGALAYGAGLRQLVFRARRHEEEELIGTLTLRPAGGRR
ncbi:hypothetical protein ACIQF6_34850 [Kitasatospora sp. NPDC092948]|uniref:hypothetical protein n=1 Tax=Kitasatospora sp. NPDC092948 TaxID=3364088 RepID=UPI003824BA97